MMLQPQISSLVPLAYSLISKQNWRKLVLVWSLAIMLSAGATNFRDATTAATSWAVQCFACFAAPIATSGADTSAVDQASASGYGNVILNQPTTWDAVSNQNVEDALALLPASVRSRLGNPDLGPVFVSVNDQGRTIAGTQPYGKAANFFSTDEGNSQIVLYPAQSAKTILHELGHAYSLRHSPGGSYGAAYLDPEFRDFMAAASWRLLTPESQLGSLQRQSQVAVVLDGASPWTNLSRNDPLEDFANSFAYYFASPEQLAQLSPARYEWFAVHLPK